MRERLINRRQQGDLGEASAIEWLTSKGALVWLPLGHSPDVDLLAEIAGHFVRVQVKTSTCCDWTSQGHRRYSVQLATGGGNQSWTGVTKRLDLDRIDYLFALVGDGRRWFIPAQALEAQRTVRLGGPKYASFEAERGTAIDPLVYGKRDSTLESNGRQGEYRSGQTGGAVNAMVQSFAGSNPASPIRLRARPKFERRDGRMGQAVVWEKRRVTIPLKPFDEAGLSIGDRMRVRADGPGRVTLERIEPPGNTLFT